MTAWERITSFFQSFYNDIRLTDIDPQIIHFYQIGLVAGILLTTTLAWFPGKPLGIPYGTLGSGDVVQEESKKVDPAAGSNASVWAGDKIPQKDLERLQKKFKLTDDQMKQVMDRSRGEFHCQPVMNDARAFHDQINMIVYAVIIAVLVYVINRDYNDFVSFWFARYFPTEARTLGMFVPEPQNKDS